MAEMRAAAPVIKPAALGLAGFALTTFMLSAHNAGWANDLTWVGLAFFYGGLAQLTAGMWEFKAGDTFGAVAFSSYGGFWMSLATFVVLVLTGKVPMAQLGNDLGWFLLAFAIFNTYMMILSLRTNVAVFLVFLTLEVTEILLFLGFFSGSTALIQIGGYVGVLTALVAWYTSFATIANVMGSQGVLPVGRAIWSESPRGMAATGRPEVAS